MASSTGISSHLAIRSALRTARRAAQCSRSYATTKDQNVPRSREIEELPESFNLDEISSMAHQELETHRELRDMARTAVWEMPLLSALHKPFEPPTAATPLRWRYTTYLGELHPAANKVVVEFSLRDLKELSSEERETMRKIVGARWDPETDIVKMSCESFETQAQNKRYLGETIASLIKEAKEGADKFTDVPLDVRHAIARARRRHKRTPGVRFPEEWRMTPERRAALVAKAGRSPGPVQTQAQIEDRPPPTQEQATEAIRQVAIASGQMDAPEGYNKNLDSVRSSTVVSGIEAIDAARGIDSQRVEEPVMAEARRPLPKGKMGKREFNQMPVQRR